MIWVVLVGAALWLACKYVIDPMCDDIFRTWYDDETWDEFCKRVDK